ncbi:hypothetical protein [Hyphomicrobium sp.]|jgi:hypothetical protein|uniref:hypothetical protein n=1 Tax=Hyphomicrobium sp. TaxID=82 RepID=UPI00356A2034
MAWVGDIWKSHISAPILIFGAIFIISAIKLTSLLPERFYFRFSSLASSEASPFIVEPPGVSYSRLCQIVGKYQTEHPGYSADLQCSTSAQSAPTDDYGKKNQEAIFRAAYDNDAAIRRDMAFKLNDFASPKFDPLGIQQTIEAATATGKVQDTIVDQYTNDVERRFREIAPSLAGPAALSAALPPDPAGSQNEGDQNAGAASSKLDPTLTAAAAKAALETSDKFPARFSNFAFAPITKAKLDEITANAYNKDNANDGIIGYYLGQVDDAFKQELRASLKRGNVDLSADASSIDKAIVSEGIFPYAIAILVRIGPVLIFGFFIGLVFGTKEIGSAAITAGLSAFLLAWPVILMWDRVVSYTWQDKRDIFIAMYILYVLSFIFVARFAAQLGALLHRRLPPNWAGRNPDEVNESAFSWSLARDFTVGIMVNILFYVSNAFAGTHFGG